MEREETRELQTREYSTREMSDEFSFEEPNLLDIPESVRQRFENEGLALRWIRVSVKGKDDITNVSKRKQDGWEFVDPKDVPEMSESSFVRSEGRYTNTISRGDLALAYAPKARMVARQRFYENRAAEMMDAVDRQLMNHSTREMPISNQSRSRTVKGRTPYFKEDE